ncbi:MAG: flagellar hook-length control protein FliK [Pseudomonadota bacterium]
MNLPITVNNAFAAGKPGQPSASTPAEEGKSAGQFRQILARQIDNHGKAANEGAKSKPEKTAQPQPAQSSKPSQPAQPGQVTQQPGQTASPNADAAVDTTSASGQPAAETTIANAPTTAVGVLQLPQQAATEIAETASQSTATIPQEKTASQLRGSEKKENIPDAPAQPASDQTAVAAAVAAMNIPQQAASAPITTSGDAANDFVQEGRAKPAGAEGFMQTATQKMPAATGAPDKAAPALPQAAPGHDAGASKADNFMNMMAALTAVQSKTANAPADELQNTANIIQSLSAPKADQATAAAQTLSAAQTQTNVATAAQLNVATPVSHPKWGDDFNQKITWLATQNQQSAELHLNPPQLGPIDVVVKVSGDQATALFTSPHAAVREAVEQALPKLRDMLADSGITLGNATVSDQAPKDQQSAFAQKQAQSGSTSSPVSDNITPVVQQGVRSIPASRHNGMVDTFA